MSTENSGSKKKANLVSFEDATANLLPNTTSCFACKEAALGSSDLSKDYAGLQSVISSISYSASTEYLIDHIKHTFDTIIRPNEEVDPGDWTREQIKEHLFSHMIDASLEVKHIIDELRLIRQGIKNSMCTVNEAGVTEFDQQKVNEYLRVSDQILKTARCPM